MASVPHSSSFGSPSSGVDPKKLITELNQIIEKMTQSLIGQGTGDVPRLRRQLEQIAEKLKTSYANPGNAAGKSLVDQLVHSCPPQFESDDEDFLGKMCYLAGIGDTLNDTLAHPEKHLTSDQVEAKIYAHGMRHALDVLKNDTQPDFQKGRNYDPYRLVVGQLGEFCQQLKGLDSKNSGKYDEIFAKVRELDFHNKNHQENVESCKLIKNMLPDIP
jgi:hypothetical protein